LSAGLASLDEFYNVFQAYLDFKRRQRISPSDDATKLALVHQEFATIISGIREMYGPAMDNEGLFCILHYWANIQVL
jgi:hypothetical protein